MSISSWMIRTRSLRARGRAMPEDYYRLDPNKSHLENAVEIYRELSSRTTAESRRLSLLNALVKLTEESGTVCGFTTEEYFYCLSVSLVHHFTQVRAGTLRAIRHLMKTSKDIQTFNNLQLLHLVCRSLDVLLDNEEERVQALKLVRKMLAISPETISPPLVRSLVALGDSGIEDGDRMLRACLATLCELGVLNPTLLIICGGVSAITRNVLECHSPRIAESLVGVLLHLLEWPQTRNIAGVHLDCLAAPYCDFTYRLGIMDKNKDARDLRFTCSRLALLSVLRSWAGTIEFCNPNKPSGLKAIVDVLYLNQLEVRKAILDLLYELLWLPQPVWTDEYSVALAVIDPSDYQDGWRLSEGFVAMEGRNVLPSLASRVPNICEIHTALLLYCFIETGLLNALVEVVVSSDTFISVRATVLIGKLLQLMHTHLPADIINTCSALPTLISHATQGNHQAKASITALQTLHQMLKNRPAACSLFLDTIIQSGNITNSKIFKREIDTAEQISVILPTRYGTLERRRLDSVGSSHSNEERMPVVTSVTSKRGSIKRSIMRQFFEHIKQNEKLMRDSNVLLNEDGKSWDWDIIVAILRTDAVNKMDDNQTRFIRRLVNFYKPTNNRFSHQDLGHGRHIPAYITAGLELIDWLIQSEALECIRLLTDLFSDVNSQLMAICTSRSAHDCLFSPQHMSSTMCQQYFLFIGRMCRTQKGIVILNNTDIFKQLTNIVQTTLHVCYIKLIVSGLDYTYDEMPRKILEKAMMATDRRDGRLYATQFTLVLLRAKIQNFEVWGLPLLIKQTKDMDRVVALAALEILDEAAHDRIYLEELVNIWPDFERLGDAGKLLMVRFYSIPRGLNHTNARVRQRIDYWMNGYNKTYVLLVEADTHSILTLHTKNEEGAYSRRSCSSRPTIIPPNILPHLYGQLVQTSQGLSNLVKFGNLLQLIDILTQAKCNNEHESLILKSAMWALGHTATSRIGIEHLGEADKKIFEKFIFLAKHCEVYSIRSTALHVLGLFGSTKAGADILYKFDWICVRHDRDTYWPICEPEDWISKHITPIRHQIDEVPPYNYAGIEENISAIFDSSIDDTTCTYYFDESSLDRVDGTSNVDIRAPNNGTASNRSKTLPEGTTKPGFIKHTRSLSESKTTDGLSLMAVSSRTRFNSGTDSNTSGVSSCESVYARYMIPDLQNTLSPIPSSSNLLDVKKSNERFRRVSLTGASFRENTLSPQDVQGYAKLRKLRSNQRPMLSESAADELADIMDVTGDSSGSKQQQHRRLKVRSLDRHSTLTYGYDEIHPRTQSIESAARIMTADDSNGPCYAGICLPKNILDLFQTQKLPGTYVSRFANEIDSIEVSARLNNKITSGSFIVDAFTEGDESSVSSLSDISTNSKRSKWVGKHNRNNCLLCCRSLKMTTNSNATNKTLDSNDIYAMRRKISNHSSQMQLSDISFNSPESVFSEEYMPDRITANILRHIQRMANPVWSKQSKMALLEMKQKHPQSFQDICLYSEVCKALSSNTYRLYARRFLQELFLDMDFDVFGVEPSDIINRKERELSTMAVMSATLDYDTVDDGGGGGAANVKRDAISSNGLLMTSPLTNVDHIYANIKTHIRPPQLASVYETSVENLAESLGKVKHLDDKIQQKRRTGAITFNNVHHRHSETPTMPPPQPGDYMHLNNNKSSKLDVTTVSRLMRPRFNTLELDLSCTKNKFPITDRRKKIEELIRDKNDVLSDGVALKWRRIGDQSDAGAAATGSVMQENSSSGPNEAPLLVSPTSPDSINLFCYKRLITSKSEATLTQGNDQSSRQ